MLVGSACEHLLHLLDGWHTDGIVASGGCRHCWPVCCLPQSLTPHLEFPVPARAWKFTVSIQVGRPVPIIHMDRPCDLERKHREDRVDLSSAPHRQWLLRREPLYHFGPSAF